MIRRTIKNEWKNGRLMLSIPLLLVLISSLAFSPRPLVSSIGDSSSGILHALHLGRSKYIPTGYPIPNNHSFRFTSGFGMRTHPIKNIKLMHKGVDLAAPKGTPIISTADGEIVHIEKNWMKGKGYGRYVVIDHSNGYETLYSQLNTYEITMGQKVKKGTILGSIGSSGISTGYHLHYEIKKNGEQVDPSSFLSADD